MISFCVGQKLDHVMYDVSKISEEFLCCPFVKLFDASMCSTRCYTCQVFNSAIMVMLYQVISIS